MSEPDIQSKDQRSVVRLYAMFGAGIALSVIPSALAALVSLFLIVGVLIAAYFLRGNNEDTSLVYNHTTFVIRTIWISGFITILTMAAGSIYLFLNVDNEPLLPCIQDLMNIQTTTQIHELLSKQDLLKDCLADYLQNNFLVFIVAASITAGPVLVYLLVRYARGLSRAIKGYRIANPLEWF